MFDSFFKAIADANRRKILLLLKKKGTMSAGEIATHFDISKPALSEHLKILKNADLITAIKKKQYIYYALNTTVFEDILAFISEIINKSEV
ncbi:MAG TPA: autorepressor SdpR family transcription factor [Candidatus Cloacimonas acidaminovorans]|jgi:DNA-binding transcriptional ArsR family regulator|nr:helix-turn-helix transcriptional regulator [Candidatus Cloacimonas sp.]HPI42231.1 autorepressor SdpR family transcription factor [Candidatus Cloacimonas acidaminovorans]